MRTKTLYIILVVVALVIFCIISTFFGIVPLDTLPINFFGAALGALIGALITFILLKGQKDFEENKDKNIKILERKMEIFQDYIKDVWEVWADQKITLKEFQNLTSKYYQNLMIYLKNKDKTNQETRLEKIGNYLSEMGKCIDKPENIDTLREQIVGIINELSEELELGGKVNTNIMNTHDEIVFPLLFRNKILDSFNEYLVSPNSDILEKGQWLKWNEGNNIIHDDLVFNFKKYPDCSIRFGFACDSNGKYNDNMVFIFYVPIGANYHSFDKYRAAINSILNRRIKISGYHNILGKSSRQDDIMDIPSFNFSDEKIKEIRKNYNYFHQIAETLALRAGDIFLEITVEGDNSSSLAEFLEKYYGKK